MQDTAYYIYMVPGLIKGIKQVLNDRLYPWNSRVLNNSNTQSLKWTNGHMSLLYYQLLVSLVVPGNTNDRKEYVEAKMTQYGFFFHIELMKTKHAHCFASHFQGKLHLTFSHLSPEPGCISNAYLNACHCRSRDDFGDLSTLYPVFTFSTNHEIS